MAQLSRRHRLAVGAATLAVLTVLGVAAAGSATFQRVARAQLYADPVAHAQTSRYQEIVLTRSAPFAGPADTRLFLNGDLQFSSLDEYRYHEALVHPVMAGAHQRVLVLGRGDGLALREVLRYPDVAEVVEVELDAAVVELARTPAVARPRKRDAARRPRARGVRLGPGLRCHSLAGRVDPRRDTVSARRSPGALIRPDRSVGSSVSIVVSVLVVPVIWAGRRLRWRVVGRRGWSGRHFRWP